MSRTTWIAIALGLLLAVAAAALAWRHFDNRPAAASGPGKAVRGLLVEAINAAVPLWQLAARDLTAIRAAPGGEPAWRDDIDNAIVDLQLRINRVTGNPGVEALSQRSRFLLTRLPARLEKLRQDVRRRSATIEQSACSVVLQGTREVAALDGRLPDNCSGVGQDDCEPFVRSYLVVLGLPGDVCM